MSIRVIDTETTGLSPGHGAEVVEIASVDLLRREDGTLYVGNAMQTFVRPMKPIPPETSAVHHIIDEDVKDAPFIDEAIKPFLGADVYVAHNWAFDRNFLIPLQDLDLKAICTLKVAKQLWPQMKSHKNQAIRYELGLVEPFGTPRAEIQPHRALSDVTVTAAILAHILENKLAPFAQLIEWTRSPAKYATVPLGKHKGKSWSAMEADYLEWMCKSDMDEDIKAAAKGELERRRKPIAA